MASSRLGRGRRRGHPAAAEATRQLFRRLAPAGCLLLALPTACANSVPSRHPVEALADARITSMTPSRMALLPFGSSIDADADPDRLAAAMVGSIVGQAITSRLATSLQPVAAEVLATAGVRTVQGNMQADAGDEAAAFLQEVAAASQADVLLCGIVEIWEQRDKVGDRSRTRVGIAAALFDGATGVRLWFARDSDARYGALGEPPDFGAVVRLVADNLAQSLPARAP